jgi:hypothetical protein
VPWPFPVLVPLWEAAPLSAALLLAGTLYQTSHPRAMAVVPTTTVSNAADVTLAASTIRGADHKMPVPAVIPATLNAVHAGRPATPRGAY